MRIAVCLSGQPRTWRHTLPSLKAWFADHEVEIFLHTWEEGPPDEQAALIAACRPAAYLLEPRPLFLGGKRRMAQRYPTRPPLGTVDMFHSLARSLELALHAHAAGPGFDLICRSRFDLLHDGHWDGEAPPPGEVKVSAGFDGQAACNDQFALGDPDAMAAYAGVSAWLAGPGLDGAVDGPWFRPEFALYRYLTAACGLAVRREAFAVKLLREGEAGKPFAAVRDEPLFQAVKYEEWEAFAHAHFPRDLAGRLDFSHLSREPLDLDRSLMAFLDGQPPAMREGLLRAPWPERIKAVDGFVAAAVSDRIDATNYALVRTFCAALLYRMDPDEPVTPESFVALSLSASPFDLRRARAWAAENQARANELLLPVLAGLGPLDQAFRLTPPLDQEGRLGWRL